MADPGQSPRNATDTDPGYFILEVVVTTIDMRFQPVDPG
jgi:hypothetical protein